MFRADGGSDTDGTRRDFATPSFSLAPSFCAGKVIGPCSGPGPVEPQVSHERCVDDHQ